MPRIQPMYTTEELYRIYIDTELKNIGTYYLMYAAAALNKNQ